MMDVLHADTVLESRMGTDLRNYGVLDGIDEAKELIAGMIDTKPENVIVYGNASLNIMYDTVSRSMVHGVLGHTPWMKQGRSGSSARYPAMTAIFPSVNFSALRWSMCRSMRTARIWTWWRSWSAKILHQGNLVCAEIFQPHRNILLR